MIENKKCIRCGVVYPFTSEYFYYRNKSKGVLYSHCKKCQSKSIHKAEKNNNNKIKHLHIKINEDEKKIIEENAQRMGLDISKYVRLVLLTNKPVVIKDIADFTEVENVVGNIDYEIKKLGNNVNQIAHRLNAGKGVSLNTVNALVDVLERLNKRMERINSVIEKSYDVLYK